MRIAAADARRRFAAARVARLATSTPDGRPHLVPVTFAVAADRPGGDRIYTAVDAKPKTTAALQRLRNIEADPRVALLADQYTDDWDGLWWARADGVAAVLTDQGELAVALRLLAARYPQYRGQSPPGPVISVRVKRWSGWAAGPR